MHNGSPDRPCIAEGPRKAAVLKPLDVPARPQLSLHADLRTPSPFLRFQSRPAHDPGAESLHAAALSLGAQTKPGLQCSVRNGQIQAVRCQYIQTKQHPLQRDLASRSGARLVLAAGGDVAHPRQRLVAALLNNLQVPHLHAAPVRHQSGMPCSQQPTGCSMAQHLRPCSGDTQVRKDCCPATPWGTTECLLMLGPLTWR